MLLLNVWVTNIIDGALIFGGRVAAVLTDLDGGHNGTAELIHQEECGFKESWLITLHLGIPLKAATHAVTNILGVTVCVDVIVLASTPGFRPQMGKALMGRRRAVDFIGLSWIVSVFLMWHPLLISCIDTTAFLVILYTWAIYMSVAGITILGLIFSVCRNVSKSPRTSHHVNVTHVTTNNKHNAKGSKSKVTSVLIQLILFIVIMLPWPLYETLQVRHPTHETILDKIHKQYFKELSFTDLYQILRLMPFVYYAVQPLCLLMFREVQARLPCAPPQYGEVTRGHGRAEFEPLGREIRNDSELNEIESVL